MRKIYLLVVFSLAFVTGVLAQERTVTGQITSSDDGSALPGVTVVLKGTTSGTITDTDGNFRLSVPESGGTLVFSFIGFATQEVEIGDRTVFNVPMSTDVTELSEVVVTALNIPREKKTLGYATQTVDQENLRVARETNLNNAMAGKVSGVQVVSGSGAKFGEAGIRIRGVRGLSAGAPLYILDGIVVNDASAINMDNVESINVLKGASAAALYGNRARDGVVIVTSKKSAKGSVTVDFNNSTTFEEVYVLPENQNEYGGGYSQTWDTFSYDPSIDDPALANLDGQRIPYFGADESWGPRLDGVQVAQWDAFTPGTEGYGQTRAWEASPNNIRDFYETGVTVNNNLSIGSATEDYNIRASLTNISRGGVLPNTDQGKVFLNLSGEVKMSEKFTMNAALNYNRTNTTGQLDEGYGSIASNLNQWWQRQLDMDLLQEYYRMPDGRYTSWNMRSARNPRPLYWDNPYTWQEAYTGFSKQENIYAKFGLSYEIIEGLVLNGNVYRGARTGFSESQAGSGTLALPGYGTSSYQNTEDNFELIMTYNKQLNENFSISALAGGNIRENEWYNWGVSTAGGLSVPALYNVKASVDRPGASNSKSFKQVNSVFAQASVGFREIVYLDATIRSDWSSTLPENDNQYVYPSVSTTFIFSELIDNQTTFSFGKLRLSYAEVGADIGPYQLTPQFGVGTPYGNIATMSVPNTLPNANLQAATTVSYEAGVELGFLNNRLRADFAAYQYRNENEIINVSVPSSSGVSSAQVNAGLTTSTGWELTLGGTPVRSGDWNWDINVNVATFTNKVEELYPGLTTIRIGNGWNGTGTGGGWGSPSAVARVGDDWGTVLGRAFIRDENGNLIVGSNGQLQWEDNKVLGNILPDFTGGIFNRVTYKNFDLGVTLDFQSGGLIHSITNMFTNYSGLGIATVGNNDRGVPQRDPVADGGGLKFEGVKEDGTPNDVYLEADSYWKSLFAQHERWMYDASFVKLREVRLGYTLPSSLLENVFIKTASIAVIGNNLWLIHSNVPGIDPSEVSGQVRNARTNGAWVEGGQLPGTRSIGFDIRLGF